MVFAPRRKPPRTDAEAAQIREMLKATEQEHNGRSSEGGANGSRKKKSDEGRSRGGGETDGRERSKVDEQEPSGRSGGERAKDKIRERPRIDKQQQSRQKDIIRKKPQVDEEEQSDRSVGRRKAGMQEMSTTDDTRDAPRPSRSGRQKLREKDALSFTESGENVPSSQQNNDYPGGVATDADMLASRCEGEAVLPLSIRSALFGKKYAALGMSNMDAEEDFDVALSLSAGESLLRNHASIDDSRELMQMGGAHMGPPEIQSVRGLKTPLLCVCFVLSVASVTALTLLTLLPQPLPRLHYLANQGYTCSLEAGAPNMLEQANVPFVGVSMNGLPCWKEVQGLEIAQGDGQCTFVAEEEYSEDGHTCVLAIRYFAVPLRGLATAGNGRSLVTCQDISLPDD